MLVPNQLLLNKIEATSHRRRPHHHFPLLQLTPYSNLPEPETHRDYLSGHSDSMRTSPRESVAQIKQQIIKLRTETPQFDLIAKERSRSCLLQRMKKIKVPQRQPEPPYRSRGNNASLLPIIGKQMPPQLDREGIILGAVQLRRQMRHRLQRLPQWRNTEEKEVEITVEGWTGKEDWGLGLVDAL